MSGFGLPPPTTHHYPPQFNNSSSSNNQLPPPRLPPTAAHSHSSSSMRPAPTYRYELEIAQQPIRARMCGFGDKDRRPVSPPPLVRLRIFDERNNEVKDLTDVDINFFILSVDLYDAERNQEQNLVLHPSNAGSVPSSSAPTTPPPPPPPYHSQAQSYPNSEHPYYQHQYPYMPPPGNEAGYQHGPYVPQPYGQHQGGYGPPPQEYNSNVPQNYTRNLIGSLCASAFRLKDTKDELGIWFVLQDLSVRTEGTFTLKLSFFNVGADLAEPRRSGNSLNTGRSTVLAVAFTQPFEVSKAKGFQGMVDASPLSLAFAKQGVRINTRGGDHPDGNTDKNGGDDNDDDAD